MNIVNISDNIAWDGQHFFCRRCGKAGYDKMSQVRGHLAMCRGNAMQMKEADRFDIPVWRCRK